MNSLNGTEEQGYGEYEVKAVFIYNFAKFVRWPEGHFKKGKGNINLCILGSEFPVDAFDFLEGKTAQGYGFTVKRLKTLSNINECDMLFICSSERYRIGQIIKRIKNIPILTIGDTDGFAEKGVIINLYKEDNRIRFEINVDAAKEAQLSISSQLLKVAKIIKEQK